MTEPTTAAHRSPPGEVSPVAASAPMNPPAKESPAPVGFNDAIQRERRRDEQPVAVREKDAVLSTLDHDGARSHALKFPRRPDDVALAGQHPRLALVQKQRVNLARLPLPDRRAATVSRSPSSPAPPIWGLASICPQHVQLQRRVNVGEEHGVGLAVAFAERRGELREHV